MKKIVWPFSIYSGLLSGLLFSLFAIGVYLAGGNPFTKLELMFMPIYAVVMVGSLMYVRNTRNGGYLQTAHGITYSFLSGITANVLYAVLVYLFLGFLFPEALDKHIAELQAWLSDGKENFIKEFGEEAFLQMQKANETINARTVAADKLIKMFIPVVVISVISAMFCRREPAKS